MQQLKTLIDKASEVCGSDAALARKLKISRQLLSMMHNGKRKVTPIQAAKLADIAGYDLDAALRAAVIEAARDTPDEYQILEIVGKVRAAGGAGMSPFSYKGASTYSIETAVPKTDSEPQSNTLYIASRKRAKRGLKSWLHSILTQSGQIARRESPMGWA